MRPREMEADYGGQAPARGVKVGAQERQDRQRRREVRRDRPRAEATALGGLLEQVLANLDMGEKLREHLALTAWPQIAGRVVAGHTRAEAVRDGVLLVWTDTPAWAQELHMRKGDLLAKVTAQVGEGVIRDIHFRAGMRSVRGAEKRESPPPRVSSIRLSEEEIREAKEAAGRTEDADLRAKAERAFLALAKMSRWREERGWRRCERCGQWQRTGRRWCGSCIHRGRRPARPGAEGK